MHIGVGILSVIIALVANAAAHFMPRQATAAQQSSASAQTAGTSRVEYGSLSSSALGRELKFAVQFPPSYETDAKRRYPVLYFLHGMFGNEREFERRGVAAAISKMRDEGKIGDFIIVAPAGENSFYLNAKNGAQYEDAIIKDLIPYIEKTYRVMNKPADRAIQGISMGGWERCFWRRRDRPETAGPAAHSDIPLTVCPAPTRSCDCARRRMAC